MNRKEYYLDGKVCAHCCQKIEKKVGELHSVDSTRMDFLQKTLTVYYKDEVPVDNIVIENIIHHYEPKVTVLQRENKQSAKENNIPADRRKWIELSTAVLLAIFTAVIIKQQAIYVTLFVIAWIMAGKDVIKACISNVRNRNWLDENFLMTIAGLGALSLQQYEEAIGVMVFYEIGQLLEDRVVNRARKRIANLVDLKPPIAHLVKETAIVDIIPEDLRIDDIVEIRSGERIPLDGVIINGEAEINLSNLTGESKPVHATVGDSIYGGSLNQQGLLRIRVTHQYKDSAVARLLTMIESAGARKSKAEHFITRFAKIYTPVVVIVAVLIAIVPILFGYTANIWLYRALTFLVISCPCALVLSVPLAYIGGIGAASKRGVLIKGSHYLDLLTKMDILCIDKTGTLTTGELQVDKIITGGTLTSDQILQLASSIEGHATHPIALAIKQVSHTESIDWTSYNEYPGQGVIAELNGQKYALGNEKLMQSQSIIVPLFTENSTLVYLSVDGQYQGAVLLSDQLRQNVGQQLKDLKSDGIEKQVLLSGDQNSAVSHIASEVGIDNWNAGLLPEGKVEAIESLLGVNHTVGFIGDGMNDAPVLARADIGIAMGGLGTDLAIEAADVVLMQDDFSQLLIGRRIGRITARIVKQNIFLALGTKAAVMILGVLGISTLWEAVFADVGVALLAVLNSARIMAEKDLR